MYTENRERTFTPVHFALLFIADALMVGQQYFDEALNRVWWPIPVLFMTTFVAMVQAQDVRPAITVGVLLAYFVCVTKRRYALRAVAAGLLFMAIRLVLENNATIQTFLAHK
jgi:hypothetical protein